MKLTPLLLAGPAMVLAGCQSAPAPAGEPAPQAMTEAPACPDIAPGSGTFTPPFPSDCDRVKTGPEGLQWLVLTEGPEDKSPPEDGATVIVDYEGYLASDGTRIDSSFERGEPAVFKIGQVIEGWTRTLKRMAPGDEWLVYIPSELAYGATSPGDDVPANSDLVFKIRLQGYMSQEDSADLERETASAGGLGPAPELWDEFLPWNASREDVTMLDSGLSYVVLDSGAGTGPQVSADDMVAVDYEARLADETRRVVGTTWNEKQPLVVKAGNVIPGFAEALTLMKPGDLWIAHMPANIAYGDEGLGDAVPPGADLVYLINLITLNPRTPAQPG